MGIDGAEIKRASDKLDRLMAENKAAAEEKKRKDEEAVAASEMLAKQFEEEQAARKAAEVKRKEIERKRSVNQGLPFLDCAACKTEKSMIATSIHRFGEFIRFIGYLIAVPSVLGFLFSLLTFCGTIIATSDISAKAASPVYHAGVAIGSTIGIVGAMVFGGASLIGGLIGYLLLTKKKVFRCRVCGYILDRA